MRWIMLLALALLLCSSGALCQMNNDTAFKELNASALRALVVDSSAKLESYRFFLEMEQSMELVNLSSGEAQKLYTRSFGFGSLNMISRALKLVMASLTLPEGDEENATATALEEYLLNDTIYLKLDGNWTAMRLPGVAEAWSRQNTMEQQVDMFNQSNLSLQSSETVGGKDCYKVRADIDMASFADQLSKQTSSYLPLQPVNYTQLFSNMTLEAYYWITKDTHLLKKTEMRESFIVSPASLGLPAKGPEKQEMRANITITMLFGGFNENVNVKLPAEARKAEPLSLNLTASGQPVLPAQAANNTTQAALKA